MNYNTLKPDIQLLTQFNINAISKPMETSGLSSENYSTFIQGSLILLNPFLPFTNIEFNWHVMFVKLSCILMLIK